MAPLVVLQAGSDIGVNAIFVNPVPGAVAGGAVTRRATIWPRGAEPPAGGEGP